jgi:hypothetical protein
MRTLNPNSKTDSSRILIHADNADREGGNHPLWKGAGDQELTACPFAEADLDHMKGMSEINSRLERVLDKAPSDSTANLLVRKTKDGYRAFLKIRSANQRFAGSMSGRRLIDVVERVIKDVRGQIDDWKQHRQLVDEGV